MMRFVAGCYRSGSLLVKPGGSTRSLILMLLSIGVSSTTSEAIPGCVCPGDKVIYRCTVQGSRNGATVWNGTAFSGCLQSEIRLQHQQFTPTGGPTRTCNNEAIVGRSLGVQGNNYTSQLNVTITSETAGKTIMCVYDALTNDETQNMIKFSIVVPGQSNKLNISASTANFVSRRRLTFSWSPVAPDCPATIHYNILASNCGNCPTTTNHTNVTCTNVPAENSVCTFAIQTVLCKSVIESDQVIVITTRAETIIKDSLSTLIPGALMLFLAVVLITGCVLYVVFTKRLCSQCNKVQENSKGVDSMGYSVCERPSSNRSRNNNLQVEYDKTFHEN